MRRIEYVKVLVVLVGLMVAGGGSVWGAAGDILWTFKADDKIQSSSPAIGNDGTIYFGCVDNNLYAVSSNGSLKWKYNTGNDINLSSASIGPDGTIYFGSTDGYLYAITQNGTLKWKYNTGNSIYMTPTIGIDNTIYIANLDGDLYAIKSDGTLKWSYAIDLIIDQTSIAIDENEILYIGSGHLDENNIFFAFTSTGAKLWEHEVEGAIRCSPAIGSDGTIYIGTEVNSESIYSSIMYAFNPNGSLKWSFNDISGRVWSSPAIDIDGSLYFGSHGFYALNPDGSLKWKNSNTGGYNSPVIANNEIIYNAGDGQIDLISKDGSHITSYEIASDIFLYSNPNINSEGIMYVTSDDGSLYAVDLGEGVELADSPWPKFLCNQKNNGRKSDLYFAEIPGGAFTPRGKNENVTIEPFKMSLTEITNMQYVDFLNEALTDDKINVQGNSVKASITGPLNDQLCLDLSWSENENNKCWITFDGSTFNVLSEKKNWPIINLTWYGAKIYANHYGYELPTLEEFEWASQGGENYEYATVNGTLNDNTANYGNNIGYPVDVGSYQPNPYGIYDLCGNATEFVKLVNWPYGGDFVRDSVYCRIGQGNREAFYYSRGFRIVNHGINQSIISPNGGEVFYPNMIMEIFWQSKPFNLDIEYSTDSGSTWNMIISDISGISESYYWTIPNIESSDCLIKITNSDNSEIFDISDTSFSIISDANDVIIDGIKLISLPEGNFEMGAKEGYDEEMPQHNVSLNGFLISATEITQKQYELIMGESRSKFPFNGSIPVNNVSWYEATEFCNKLSIKYGLEPCYDENTWKCDYTKKGFRLPTDAEWEYACRAGTLTNYSYGDYESELVDGGWYYRNSHGFLHPVGQNVPNAWGIYDMHGNIWEWSNDWFQADYYANSPSLNPLGPENGSLHSIRGGDYLSHYLWMTSSMRFTKAPEDYSEIGFRIVRREIRSIQGKILHNNGTPIQFASIQINGAVTDTTVVTDDTGTYTLAGWLGGDYTITPNKVGCTFSPASLTVSIGFEDVTDADFTATVDEKYIIEHGITLAAIPAGSFEMGSDDGNDDEKPVHTVTLDGFLIGATEVTQGQYEGVMGENPSKFTGDMSLPVDMVDRPDALVFCNILSTEQGLEPCYDKDWLCDFSKNGYRLPTEAEWEYACRVGTTTKFNTGDNESDLSRAGWWSENSGYQSHPVGQKEPNEWGLFDMHGNLHEMCNEYYDSDYYSNSSQHNPVGPDSGFERVARGGSYDNPDSDQCRSTYRDDRTESGGENLGFRIVRRDTRTIQGTVKLSGSPLKDANLLITGAVMDTVVTTDDTGSFSLSGWLAGDYTITPRKVGFTFSPDTTYVSVGFEDVTVDAFEAEVDTRYVVEQGIHFAKIPTGTFDMGSTTGEVNEPPVHTVTLLDFNIAATEITQEQYETVFGSNPSYYKGNINLPVETVSWYNAVTFCNALSISQGLEPCYNLTTWVCDINKSGYRLPTEAEWEYSCHAGTATRYYNGGTESDLDRAGWYSGNSNDLTHPVGQKEPNEWGLYDMHGNVHEWCNDWYASYGSDSQIDPTGPASGTERVIRGGNKGDDAFNNRSTVRRGSNPSDTLFWIGFRIVRSFFTIEGTILDDSGFPVSGAEILIASADTDTTVTTDENGFYNLSGLEKGSYTLSPSKFGYGFAEPSYTVATDSRLQIADITALSYLTLTTPQGGEFWETWTEQAITWTSNFLSTIKIEYSDDGGSSWAMIASSIDATLGSYMWTVPDLESTDCMIRVTDTIDANVTDKSEAVFTVTKPVFLTLTSMNEGEELVNLDTYQITWQSHRVDIIRIEYSPDNGGRWTSIETAMDASTGTYGWTVPDIVTSECLIRLTDTTDANMNAVSEAVFTVIDPTFLTLLSPSGGEQLTQDNEYEISWDFFRVPKIRIEYTPDGGKRWVTVSSSLDTADSLFVWTVPAVNSAECKIRITDLSDANFTDMSDTFGIVPPSELMVTSPKGGEQWTAGTTVPITWTSAMLTKVTIEYSADGGENWLPVAEALDASAGTFEWAIPDTPSLTCLVRVSGVDDPETTDRSDSAFSILPAPKVTVTSPNGGEQWAAMTVRDITWDAVNIAFVKVEYSSNNGLDWFVIAESVDATAGAFAWTLPDVTSGVCQVRITSTEDSGVKDVSDKDFGMLQIPAVVLLSPNGGENLITGSTFDIKWSSAYVNNVTVELSIDNGTTWITLADAKGGTLLLPWTVPDSYSDQCLIRVYDASNDEVVDSSDVLFAIVPPPTLAVTAPTVGATWNAGTQSVITWTSLSINTLKVEYSTDNGDNWIVIEESVDASTGSVSLDVPDMYSAECLVRITDTENTETVAVSGVFTILSLPSVSIVSPNGGESFEFGSTQTIQWSATESVANILLEYSMDGGSVWNTLGSALNAADGSLSWDVPAIETTNCLVRVTDTKDANINDQSDESFSITEAPYLVLINPDGGETLTSGDLFDITWDAHRIPNIRIDYSPDGGTQWIKIADSVDGADGSLSWDVPDVSSANCLIRIVDEQDANRKNTSEAAFSIVPKPAITVTYPNGDKTLNVGSLQTITWTSVSIQSVKIEYSLDDGSTWLPVKLSIPASDGSYIWSVPDFESISCRMRISDTGSTGITDMSDAVFSAVKTSFVQLTSPAGGESWLPGTDHAISWTGSGVTNIRIELSTDGGTTWSDIVASINRLFESYTWTVPAIESSECIIRISDASDAGISDQNATAFSVASEKDSPISIESVLILDEAGIYNAKTDTLDVVVTLSNLTDEDVSDVSFVSTVDGSAVTPNYGALDADADGDIDTIQASADVVTIIGKIHLPSSSDSRTITVTQVKADGDTYALSYEDDITMIYANRDDGGTPVAYDPAVDGYSFVNPPGWSWHAFKDELKALDTAFVTKSNAVFPFFSKFANWKGRSLGMAAASNIYFSDPSLKPVSNDTYAMSLTDSDVSRDIILYGLRTLFDYLEDDEQAYDDMSELTSDAKTKLASGEPFILLLKKNQGKAVGKAVSVYKLIETATETILVAYDCEYPDGTPQFITVSTIGNTLTADDTYDRASIVNQETLSDDYAIGEEIFTPYTKKFVKQLWNDNKDFFGHASPARMLVTDPSTGNQVGFEDGTTLVNEITDSSVVEIPNEEEGTGYAFYVPHGPDYTVEFFGQETGTMYVDMIAPQSETNAAEIVFEEVEVQSGTVAVMEEIDLTAATPPSLQVDLNGDGTTDNTLEPTEAVTIVTEPVTTSITLLTPSGGERWSAGSDQSITWSSTGIVTVKLEYSADNGTTWTAITSDLQASATSYIWTVPMTESAQYLVRISDAVDSSLMDVCDVAFEIFSPATVITHTPVTEANQNQAITFSANISSDTELTSVTLYYDVSGRRTFDKSLAMVTSNDQDYSASLRQGLFTAYGIEYYIVTTDSDGKNTRDPVGTGYNSIQASLSEAISTYTVVGGLAVDSYRLISVPLELNHTSITDQLSGRLPAGDNIYDWRIFQLDVSGYNEYPNIDGFSPGSAYWFITNDEQGHRLHTREGKSVTTSASFQITLKPGWNLIADPWFFPISWGDIENPTGATLSELYSYEGNWSDPTSPPASLEPWKGYAVRNMENYNAVVDLQPIQAGTTSKIASDTKPLWTVQIAATGGGATDTANYFGAHKSSSLTWDHNDHVEPPPIGQYVSVAFPHDDWKKYPADYTVDMRPPESVTDGWAFDVRTNLPGEEITVSLLESETVPVDLDLAVIDLDTGEDISLFNGAFSFVSGDKPTDRHFAVTVGGVYQPGDDQANVTPQEFVTVRSFPNPFNPSTTISYELSHQTDVVISVYNTLGQMVRKYDLGMKAPGKHDLVFDTLGLTSGIYIYRVDAGYATATDKMMFMK